MRCVNYSNFISSYDIFTTKLKSQNYRVGSRRWNGKDHTVQESWVGRIFRQTDLN